MMLNQDSDIDTSHVFSCIGMICFTYSDQSLQRLHVYSWPLGMIMILTYANLFLALSQTPDPQRKHTWKSFLLWNIFQPLVINCVWKALVRKMTESPMDQHPSFSAEVAEPYRGTALSVALHPSCPHGTVARWGLLLNKWHMTACLEFAKWHLGDSNSTRNKYYLLFWDKNWIPWPECQAPHMVRIRLHYSTRSVIQLGETYNGGNVLGLKEYSDLRKW